MIMPHEDDNDTRGPGRPRLVEGERTKRLNARMPESLHKQSKRSTEEADIELAAAARGLFAGYNSWPAELRKSLNTEEKLRDFIAAAARNQ